MKKCPLYHRWFVLLSVFVLWASAGTTQAQTEGYDTTAEMTAESLTVTLTLNEAPSTFPFIRHIRFTNSEGLNKYVGIRFNKRTGTIYTGQISSAAGLKNLQSFAVPNNRSYWDKMEFVNLHTTDDMVLNIGKLDAWIYYDRAMSQHERSVMIASEKDVTLQEALPLNNGNGRIEYVCNKFDWSKREFDALVSPIKAAVCDLGKSGSSDEIDSKPVNPKYGLESTRPDYCGDFVSWYYHEAGYKLYGNQVYDFLSPRKVDGEMGDWFREASRRYEYDNSTQRWYLLKNDGTLDKNNTVIPKPGDYFGRYASHAMMLLNWDETNKQGIVIDGPYPAAVRYHTPVPTWNAAHPNNPLFIGRIPANTDYTYRYKTFTQTGPTSWQTAKYGLFFSNPIVVMGIPSYQGPDPATLRVRNVDRAGFQFQLDEWDYLDGGHVEENVSYLVFEKGCHVKQGMKIEAGEQIVDENWKTITINHDFTAPPVVLAQCVTRNGSAAVTTRIRNVTATSFQIRLQEEENASDGGTHNDEKVHYILFERKTTPSIRAEYVQNVTDAWKTLPSVNQSYDLFGSIQTANGPDPCCLRHNYHSGNMDIMLEEETSMDSETGHPYPETVGIVRMLAPIIE